MALLAIAGYLALTGVQVTATEPAAAEAAGSAASSPVRWRDRAREVARPAAVARSLAAARLRAVVSASAVGVIILGAAPMAVAQASPVADTILAQAIDGSATALDYPAPGFSLTDQHGRQVTLASLRGKVVLLEFLDPVCVTDCPLEAQEFRQAGQLLGADARRVELVAINLNPLYNGVPYIQAFDHQEGLAGVPDWLYLTGSPALLRQAWHLYGIADEPLPGGAMLGHNDVAFVIDRGGLVREELDFDPGPGTQATQVSLAAELAGLARKLLAS